MTLGQSTLLAPFLLVATLQVKHVICDGPLQTVDMVRAKSHYMQSQGIAHASIHAAATLLIVLTFGFGAGVALAAAAIELFVHYHIDYIKENVVKLAGWSTTDGPFWWALTLDQALHHFTYLIMALVLFRL